MDTVSLLPANTSKDPHKKRCISSKYIHLSGVLYRMCRHQGYMIRDIERKYVTTEELWKVHGEVDQVLHEIVPQLGERATNDLIEGNLKIVVDDTVIQERDAFQAENNVIQVYPTTSTLTETISSADLQQQLYFKMKLNFQDQANDPSLWDVLKVVKITTDQLYGLDFMEQIIMIRENDKLDSFSEADFKYLNKNDIKDLYYLCQNKKVNYRETKLLNSLIRHQGYMIRDMERKYVTTEELWKVHGEVDQVLHEIVPQLGERATNDLIEGNLKIVVDDTVIQERDAFQAENNVIQVYPTTSTLTETISSADLQQQFKMKLNFQDQANDPALWDVLKWVLHQNDQPKITQLIYPSNNNNNMNEMHRKRKQLLMKMRMEATLNDMLNNQFQNAKEYAYHLEQATNFMENQIIHAEPFPEVDLEEKMNRWVRKEFKNFNEDARLSIQHWKDSWHKRVYKQNQRKVRDNPEDYFSNNRITEVVKITTDQLYGLDFMEQIIMIRENDKLDSFSEADFKYLNKNDIEDLYYLCQNKKVNYRETRRLNMDEMLAKFIDDRKRKHKEMDLFIKEFRTTNELLLKEQSNLLSELKIKEKPHDDGVKNKSSSIRERTTQPLVKPQQSSIPFLNRARKEKEEALQQIFLKNLKQLDINIPFIEALVQIPKYAKYLKILLTNKSRLEEACTETMNEKCSAVLLNKLPLKEKDHRSFTIPCQVLEKHKEAEDLAANHLSRFKNPHMEVLTEREIADKFSDEHLMVLKSKFNNDEPWYADFVNYIVGKVVLQIGPSKKERGFSRKSRLTAGKNLMHLNCARII
ncbi:hypothetical protein Tco_0212769 [Tanacetum coccineum]